MWERCALVTSAFALQVYASAFVTPIARPLSHVYAAAPMTCHSSRARTSADKFSAEAIEEKWRRDADIMACKYEIQRSYIEYHDGDTALRGLAVWPLRPVARSPRHMNMPISLHALYHVTFSLQRSLGTCVFLTECSVRGVWVAGNGRQVGWRLSRTHGSRFRRRFYVLYSEQGCQYGLFCIWCRYVWCWASIVGQGGDFGIWSRVAARQEPPRASHSCRVLSDAGCAGSRRRSQVCFHRLLLWGYVRARPGSQ